MVMEAVVTTGAIRRAKLQFVTTKADPAKFLQKIGHIAQWQKYSWIRIVMRICTKIG